jgi:hypothetical protein
MGKEIQGTSTNRGTNRGTMDAVACVDFFQRGVSEAVAAGRRVQQQTLPAINKLGDAYTSELIAGAYSVVHVWKTLLNAIRAKSPGKTRQQAARRPRRTQGQRRAGRKVAARRAVA